MKLGFIYFILFSLSIVSCKSANDSDNTVKYSENHYFIDNISSRGAEMFVKYRNDSLVHCDILIKEDTCRTIIIYYFIKDSIFVSEMVSRYRFPMTDEREMRIDTIFDDLIDSVRFIDYIMDYEGNIIWRSDSVNKITYIFPEIKKKLLVGGGCF